MSGATPVEPGVGATPRPWMLHSRDRRIVCDGRQFRVAETWMTISSTGEVSEPEAAANAALIVAAVNERDALIAERDRLREALGDLMKAGEKLVAAQTELRRTDGWTDGPGSRRDKAILKFAGAEEHYAGCTERARTALTPNDGGLR